MTENVEIKQEGELNASEAVKFFDNIRNENGEKLTQSEKRGHLRFLFAKLYQNKEKNKCTLSDGKVVPIVVHHRQEGRASAYYLNTSEAPQEEILKAFAKQMEITCRLGRPEAKKTGELIVSDTKHLLDDVKSEDGKKLSGFKKQDRLNGLFRKLYERPKDNICVISGVKLPIIVERLGVNNKTMYCLNTSKYRQEIIQAFAKWANCKYCPEKEEPENLPEKQFGELTPRDCAKIFHKVENRGKVYKKYTSERLAEWFEYIYKHPHINQARLPNGSSTELVVRRQSYAQQCYCLNTADEIAKPFVLKRIAETTKAEICFKNLEIKSQSKNALYKSIIAVCKAEQKTEQTQDKIYYRTYAQKAYESLSPQSQELTVTEWLSRIAAKKGKKEK